MPGLLSKIAGAAAAFGLLASPAGALAAAQPVAPATTQSAANAWTTLSVMSTGASSSATLAAAQGDLGYRNQGVPIPVLAVWLATLGVFIWILVHDDDDHIEISPISPN